MYDRNILFAIAHIPDEMVLEACRSPRIHQRFNRKRIGLLVAVLVVAIVLTACCVVAYRYLYSMAIQNVEPYESESPKTGGGDVGLEEEAYAAAMDAAKQYMEDLMQPSEERTFRITQYKDLAVTLYPTKDMDAETALVYFLQEHEIGENTWIVEIDVTYQFEGVMSPIGSVENQWIKTLYTGSQIGFLLTREDDGYTMQSRYITANGGTMG